jgi:hypothetical protein
MDNHLKILDAQEDTEGETFCRVNQPPITTHHHVAAACEN